MCGERRVDWKGLTWTSVWKLISDPLALPNDAARKGGLLAAEGGYHYVSETESGGRWGGGGGGMGLKNLEATRGEPWVS